MTFQFLGRRKATSKQSTARERQLAIKINLNYRLNGVRFIVTTCFPPVDVQVSGLNFVNRRRGENVVNNGLNSFSARAERL